MNLQKLVKLILFIFISNLQAEIIISHESEKLNPDLINYVINELEKQGTPYSSETEERVIDRLNELNMIANHAKKINITLNKEFLSQIELNYLELAYTEYLKSYLLNNPIDDKDLQAEYEQFVLKYDEKEYYGHHILVKTKNSADHTYNQILNGEEFEEIAKNISIDDASSSNGGSLGWFKKNDMVEAFSKQLDLLEINKISAPFQTQFGWHILKISETRLLKPPVFDEIKGEIKEQLQNTKLKNHIKELKADVKN